jgi:hypothetical protein
MKPIPTATYWLAVSLILSLCSPAGCASDYHTHTCTGYGPGRDSHCHFYPDINSNSHEC